MCWHTPTSPIQTNQNVSHPCSPYLTFGFSLWFGSASIASYQVQRRAARMPGWPCQAENNASSKGQKRQKHKEHLFVFQKHLADRLEKYIQQQHTVPEQQLQSWRVQLSSSSWKRSSKHPPKTLGLQSATCMAATAPSGRPVSACRKSSTSAFRVHSSKARSP